MHDKTLHRAAIQQATSSAERTATTMLCPLRYAVAYSNYFSPMSPQGFTYGLRTANSADANCVDTSGATSSWLSSCTPA